MRSLCKNVIIDILKSEKMNLDSLEQLANLVLKDLKTFSSNDYIVSHLHVRLEMKNLMLNAAQVLPDHRSFFMSAYQEINETHMSPTTLQVTTGISIHTATEIVTHLLKILGLEKSTIEKTKLLKIFDSVDEKMNQANICFQNGDYSSTFHNLNTTLELVLKEKVGIPTTITKINTSNIIDILAKYKVEPYRYLVEARKYVLTIDNKIKHQGFSPSKIDCINGIKAMEELINKLRNTNLVLSEEICTKIFEGL